MSIIRKAVAQEIVRRKQTGYAFAKSLKAKIHPVTVMKWLYSGHRVSVSIAEQILAALDLVIVPRARLKSNGKKKQ